MTESSDSRASRKRLTLDDVIAAAIAELRATHLDRLTMRAVAARLGSSPMSLYRHVADRNELVALTVDQAARTLILPATSDDPRSWLQEMTLLVRARLLKYPGVAEHLLLNGPVGPNTLAFMDTVCAVLRQTGRSSREVAWAYDWLMTTVTVYVTKEIRMATEASSATRASALAERTRRYMAQHRELLEVVEAFDSDMEAAFIRATHGVINALVPQPS